MADVRARVRDSTDAITLASPRDLEDLLEVASAEAHAQSLLNVVILTAHNGNELYLVVGSTETVLGFTVFGPPMLHYASVGALQTIEPVLVAYVGLRHHTEFPRRYVIPSAQGTSAAVEFLASGVRPLTVTWEAV